MRNESLHLTRKKKLNWPGFGAVSGPWQTGHDRLGVLKASSAPTCTLESSATLARISSRWPEATAGQAIYRHAGQVASMMPTGSGPS